MKKLLISTLILFALIIASNYQFGNIIKAQAMIIDHKCINIKDIPDEWITKAKQDLFIGYGHTSHGSQITTGMNAIKDYFKDGKFDWNQMGGEGKLHLFEGSGYGTKYLDLDCGYAGWDELTRKFLNDFPDCNVIIWSWCGQVNDVDLDAHYLNRMNQLELDYPNVKFVYMTGHLEGTGPAGSLNKANDKIRDFCTKNNKILFDFSEIEKYDPDGLVNYDEMNCNDGCDYKLPGGGTKNWANDWLENNPDHELTKIAKTCGGCAHSVSLNCVKKGIAAWYLWARLAGWDGKIIQEGGLSFEPKFLTIGGIIKDSVKNIDVIVENESDEEIILNRIEIELLFPLKGEYIQEPQDDIKFVEEDYLPITFVGRETKHFTLRCTNTYNSNSDFVLQIVFITDHGNFPYSGQGSFTGGTGIEDQIAAKIEVIKISPNPSDKFMNLRYNLINNCKISISIFNMEGSEVLNVCKNKWYDPGSINEEIDLSKLTAGIYYIRLNTGTSIITEKIIKFNN